MGLEVNLLSFIPLIANKNIISSEAALKYFLTQALASIFLFTAILFYSFSLKTYFYIEAYPLSIETLFWSALLVKLGAAPFHFWLPEVIEGLTWVNNALLITWQKFAPLVLLSYSLVGSIFAHSVIILCTIIGALGGLNQTSLRKVIAYSSINHIGWMLAGLLVRNKFWIIYFLFYCFLSLSILCILDQLQLTQTKQLFIISDSNNFNKIFLFSNFLSLGGLPPFVGFFPKWLIIQGLSSQGAYILGGTLVVFTLIVLFYYLRVFFPAILITNTHNKWGFSQPFWSWVTTRLGATSLLRLPLFPLVYTIL